MSDVIPGVPLSGTITRVPPFVNHYPRRVSADMAPPEPRHTPTVSGSRKFPIRSCNWKSNRSQHAPHTRVRQVYMCARTVVRFAFAVCRSQTTRETAAGDRAEAGRRRVGVPVPSVDLGEREGGRNGCVFAGNPGVIIFCFFNTHIDATPSVKSKTLLTSRELVTVTQQCIGR